MLRKIIKLTMNDCWRCNETRLKDTEIFYSDECLEDVEIEVISFDSNIQNYDFYSTLDKMYSDKTLNLPVYVFQLKNGEYKVFEIKNMSMWKWELGKFIEDLKFKRLEEVLCN